MHVNEQVFWGLAEIPRDKVYACLRHQYKESTSLIRAREQRSDNNILIIQK